MNPKSSKKPSLISCVIPVFNGERYLSESLDSILKQTYQPLEVIVVDDGSTDEISRVVTKYNDTVTYIRQPNSGHGAALNRGLKLAKGEFIVFSCAHKPLC